MHFGKLADYIEKNRLSFDVIYQLDLLFADLMNNFDDDFSFTMLSQENQAIPEKLNSILPENLKLDIEYSLNCLKCHEILSKEDYFDISSMINEACYCPVCDNWIPIKINMINITLHLSSRDSIHLYERIYYENPLDDPYHECIENYFGQAIYRKEDERVLTLCKNDAFQRKLDEYFDQMNYKELDSLTISLLNSAVKALGYIPFNSTICKSEFLQQQNLHVFYLIFKQAFENEMQKKFFTPLKNFISDQKILFMNLQWIQQNSSHLNRPDEILSSYVIMGENLNLNSMFILFDELLKEHNSIDSFCSWIFHEIQVLFLIDNMKKYVSFGLGIQGLLNSCNELLSISNLCQSNTTTSDLYNEVNLVWLLMNNMAFIHF